MWVEPGVFAERITAIAMTRLTHLVNCLCARTLRRIVRE